MTDAELISRQAKQIEELKDQTADLLRRIELAQRHMICIGGPLNDNRLGYSMPQLVTFQHISEALDGN